MQGKLLTAIGSMALAMSGTAWAAGDLSRADVQTVVLEMGTNEDGSMYFKPSELNFETGKAYKLHMVNPDEIKHEVALHEMLERIFTRKVEIETAEGELVAEIKGQIHEIEIGPHQAADWYFVPIQPMEAGEITCEIAGHKEAGMRATAHIR
ncbi:MAG: hypothetical protein Kow0058_14590 [Roseovarius sp.]